MEVDYILSMMLQRQLNCKYSIQMRIPIDSHMRKLCALDSFVEIKNRPKLFVSTKPIISKLRGLPSPIPGLHSRLLLEEAGGSRANSVFI